MPRNQPLARGDYHPETTSVLTWLMCAIAGAQAVQFFAESSLLPLGTGLTNSLALNGRALTAGQVWPLLTFWLLHSTTNLLHVGIVLIAFILLSRELVPQWGCRRVLAAFALSLGLGATTWIAVHWGNAQTLIGSTAGVYGLLTLVALAHPEREFRVLIFFIFPVRIRFRHLTIALFLAELMALIFIDIVRQPIPFDYAPSSHLGGMLAGWICFQIFTRPCAACATFGSPTSKKTQLHGEEPPALPPSAGQDSNAPTGRNEVRRQLDHILDKISSEGMSALTAQERRLLDNAKQLLNRR